MAEVTPTNDSDDPATASWHLDKRVPLALILAIVVQTLVAAYGYGALVQRVDALEHGVTGRAEDHERLVRIEATVAGIDRRLERMEDR